MNGQMCHARSQALGMTHMTGVVWSVGVGIAGVLDRMSRFLNGPLEGGAGRRELPVPSPSGAPIAVLVIDASPSMDFTDWKPSRLQAAKDAANAYVARLKEGAPNARVAVVAFCEQARTVCGLTPVGRHAHLAAKIDAIDTHSATNITAGLTEALKHAKRAAGRCQVVLLTDGEHNTGPKPHSVATKLRKIATLETVGIGGSPEDVDEELLKAIASAHPDGRKRYRWIGDQKELVGHFETLAGRLARS